MHIVELPSALERLLENNGIFINRFNEEFVYRFLSQQQQQQHLTPLESLSSNEKWQLLYYLRSQFQHLYGLPLLPLENGEFATFRNMAANGTTTNSTVPSTTIILPIRANNSLFLATNISYPVLWKQNSSSNSYNTQNRISKF